MGEKLIRYVIDFGEELGKNFVFRNGQWYSPEDLMDKSAGNFEYGA